MRQSRLFKEQASVNVKRYHLKQMTIRAKNDVFALRETLGDIRDDIPTGYISPRYREADKALQEAHNALRRAIYHLEKSPVQEDYE